MQLSKLPETIRSREGCRASRSLALFVTLVRLASSDSWDKLQYFMRRRRSWLQGIFRATVKAVVSMYGTLATRLDVFRLNSVMDTFRRAVKGAGALVDDVVCFVDGKAWRTCRPMTRRPWELDFQRVFYNGHYR